MSRAKLAVREGASERTYVSFRELLSRYFSRLSQVKKLLAG